MPVCAPGPTGRSERRPSLPYREVSAHRIGLGRPAARSRVEYSAACPSRSARPAAPHRSAPSTVIGGLRDQDHCATFALSGEGAVAVYERSAVPLNGGQSPMPQPQTARPGCLSVFFASSWRLAGRLFTTRHLFTRDEDEVMDQIYAVRGYVGFAIVIAVTMRYHGAKVVAAQENQWTNITERTVLLIAAVLGAGLILALFWTRPSRWWALLKLSVAAAGGGRVLRVLLRVCAAHVVRRRQG